MAIYTVLRFGTTNVTNNSYVIKDTFAGTDIDSIKYYLIQMSANNVSIHFKFDTYILSHTFVELYKNPIVTSNGRLLSGLTTINMYADPTVTFEGTQVYDVDADSKFVEIHMLTLLAHTTYLIKIIPKDLNSTIIS
jgi:hypothetical protein